MELPPLVLQSLGSLAAILALAGLAYLMKLGGAPSLDSEAAQRQAANEVCDGFDPVAFAVSKTGEAGLARDAEGRVMLIRRHGGRFAGRLLGRDAKAAVAAGRLEIDCGEVRFGKAVLAIGNADAWAQAVNRLGYPQDA